MSHEQAQKPHAPSLAERVAMNVRAELAARRMTSADLAGRLSIGPRAAARRLSGEIDFTLNEAEAVADWLGVPMSALMAPRQSPMAVAAQSGAAA